MGNKQEELEAVVLLASYDLVAITKTWWDEWYTPGGVWLFSGYRLFRRRDGGVALYMKQVYIHTSEELSMKNSPVQVESLWVKQFQLSQPFFTGKIPHFLGHLYGPSLDSLHYVHIFLVLESPELDTTLQGTPLINTSANFPSLVSESWGHLMALSNLTCGFHPELLITGSGTHS
ncbi:hypothetical protein BTVI_103296 [Pitangus sulphuratus]|nr:hypothetical protein BTVI_103296 [Pitangus sulphuratus]